MVAAPRREHPTKLFKTDHIFIKLDNEACRRTQTVLLTTHQTITKVGYHVNMFTIFNEK